LSEQFRSRVDPINDVDVVYVVDLETWVFRTLEYSYMCRLLYFAVLCYLYGCCEFVCRFILFIFSEFVLYQCI